MGTDVIVGADGRRDSALGIDAIALTERRLGDEDHRTVRCRPQRDQKPRETASHDDHRIAEAVGRDVIYVKMT